MMKKFFTIMLELCMVCSITVLPISAHENVCTRCHGEGTITITKKCEDCGGNGKTMSHCSYCGGTGVGGDACPQCKGSGQIDGEMCEECLGRGCSSGECRHCNGSGVTWHGQCHTCKGSGTVTETITCPDCKGN